MTIGGTDYYSDVTFDLSLALGDDFRAQHTATVVKTNVSHLYPLGRKVVDLDFQQIVREVTAQEPIKQFEPARPPSQEWSPEPEVRTLSLDDLLAKAKEFGIAEVHMSKAAARYCRGKRLDQLSAEEIELLYNRLVASREQGTDGTEGAEDSHATRATGTNGRSFTQETTARAGQRLSVEELETVSEDEAVRDAEPTVSGARSNGRGRT